MQSPLSRIIRTASAAVFTEALAPGAASALYNIPLGHSVGAGGFTIRGLFANLTQSFDFALELFTTAAGAADSAVGTATWVGEIAAIKASQIQIPNLTGYFAQVLPVTFPYLDEDWYLLNAEGSLPGPQMAQPWTLHAVLVNRDTAVAKLAAASGAVQFGFLIDTVGSTAF